MKKNSSPGYNWTNFLKPS